MGILGVAVDGQIDEDVADAGQKENRAETGGHFSLYHGPCGDVDARLCAADGGEILHQRKEAGAHQIAQPDHQQGDEVVGLVVKEIAGLAGEQVIASGADGKQTDGEQQRPHDVGPHKQVLHPQEYRAAQTDADARQNGIDKGSKMFFHNVNLPSYSNCNKASQSLPPLRQIKSNAFCGGAHPRVASLAPAGQFTFCTRRKIQYRTQVCLLAASSGQRASPKGISFGHA